MYVHFPEADRYRVNTPLGKGMVYGLDADLADPQWLVILDRSGEHWWLDSRWIRRSVNVSNAFERVSPFPLVTAEMQKHIDRLTAQGYL